MKIRVRCVRTGRAATAGSTLEAAERYARREGFVQIEGKWYWDKATKESKNANSGS